MKNSHTFLLIEESFEKIQEFNYKKYINELENMSKNTQKISSSGQKHKVNQILEKLNLHLMYKSVFEELENNSYSKMGKWSSVGTLILAFKNPEKLDEVYNLFTDEDSRSTFDWFIKYRVAYAFVGKAAEFVFPPRISHDEFMRMVSGIKLDRNGFVNLGGYRFLSNLSEIAGSWLFEQYNLKELCEVSSGDHIVDGGAFRGETAFWFLSKGAEKVYAFEGDALNFEVLSKNLRLNRVKDKIIPVKALLSDKDGVSKIKMTGESISSSIVDGGTDVECTTLDSFLDKNNINRIDFIKLDVEGMELDVLKGAAETIKKYKPKMAVSVYHKPDDIILIPEFLYTLLPNAKFYLSHKSCDWNDIVFFVNPR